MDKTYLPSTISQSRLPNLATVSMENDFDDLIKVFADKKARKVKFYKFFEKIGYLINSYFIISFPFSSNGFASS